MALGAAAGAGEALPRTNATARPLAPALVAATPSALTAIREAARAAWPREACGAIGGHCSAARIDLLAVVPLPNTAAQNDRFAVDAAAFAVAAARLEQDGHRLLGFWHSHGDGNPEPSATDRRELWRDHLHVIAGVDADGVVHLGAFLLDADGDFRSLPLLEQDPAR